MDLCKTRNFLSFSTQNLLSVHRTAYKRLIIKNIYKQGLGNHEAIDIILENPYMQYLCGLSKFTDKPIFDSTQFVTIRKRISEEEINVVTTRMLLEERRQREEQDAKDKGEEPPQPQTETPDVAEFTDSKGRKHKEVLKIDATCADAEVRHPVNATLLEMACRKIDEYTSKVCDEFWIKGKRTPYRDARRSYLLLIKQKVKKGRLVAGTIAYLLNCLATAARLRMRLPTTGRSSRRLWKWNLRAWR